MSFADYSLPGTRALWLGHINKLPVCATLELTGVENPGTHVFWWKKVVRFQPLMFGLGLQSFCAYILVSRSCRRTADRHLPIRSPLLSVSAPGRQRASSAHSVRREISGISFSQGLLLCGETSSRWRQCGAEVCICGNWALRMHA